MVKDLDGEVWKVIPNTHYSVSNLGRVKNNSHQKLHNINKTYYTTKEALIKPNNTNSKKYYRVQMFYLDGIMKWMSVHRLVATCFIPNLENKPQINHIDGDKANNKVSNLEWVTDKENRDHRYLVLRNFTGKLNYVTRKLTEEQVRQIPELLKTMRIVDIAKMFNVGPTTISEIKQGRSWRELNLFPRKKKATTDKYFELRYSPNLEEIQVTKESM